MKTSRLSRVLSLLTILFCLVFLTQCELFLGENENGNVGIDLSQFYGSSRAISGMPEGVFISSFRLSVFGPGMEPMQKSVSYGTRYVNMQVPAGADRHFTLEIFFTHNSQLFDFSHLRSYKGRAIVDLRAGAKVGIRFQMAAGATSLLTEDQNLNDTGVGGCIYSAETIAGYYPLITGRLNRPAGSFFPTDLDIAANGRIFAMSGASIYFADNLPGSGADGRDVGTLTAIAIDRHAVENMPGTSASPIETNVLYVSTATGLGYFVLDVDLTLPGDPPPPPSASPTTMTAPGMSEIRGMAVDPWTHRLYLAGVDTNGNAAIVEYNPYTDTRYPGTPLRTINHSLFRTLNDIIVKDDGIFVLNQVPLSDAQTPVIIKFDRNLNYVAGFGTVSSVMAGPTQYNFEPSVAPGKFYFPQRFIAQENDGLYIIDDSNYRPAVGSDTVDKIVFINTELDPSSWRTFPSSTTANEPFDFRY